MTFSYPIQMNIENRNCLIVGAGSVGLRKAITLLNAGAIVTVIAPVFHENFDSLKKENLKIIKRSFEDRDVNGKFLIFAATNVYDVNERIVKLAKKKNILVNVADDPNSCDFIVPANLRKNDLNIAITTNGKNPSYARDLKIYLDELINDRFLDALWVYNNIRVEIKKHVSVQQEREKLMRKITILEIIGYLEHEEKEEVTRKVMKCLLH